MPDPTSDYKVDIDLDAVEAAAVRGHALDFPGNAISNAIDAFVRGVAAVFNWVWLLLIALIVVNVTLRYAIGTNFIALEELQWHLYAIGFLLGLGYAVDLDAHVRVDVIAEHWPNRRRAWIELFGILFFLIPFIWLVLASAWPFVQRAYMINEVSAAPGGLPYRWAIKAVIIVAFAYLGLAVVSRLLRVCTDLFGVPGSRAR
jgi:TRAP-type mannitol/chloroaromatic compound transport system permease small subunit